MALTCGYLMPGLTTDKKPRSLPIAGYTETEIVQRAMMHHYDNPLAVFASARAGLSATTRISVSELDCTTIIGTPVKNVDLMALVKLFVPDHYYTLGLFDRYRINADTYISMYYASTVDDAAVKLLMITETLVGTIINYIENVDDRQEVDHDAVMALTIVK